MAPYAETAECVQGLQSADSRLRYLLPPMAPHAILPHRHGGARECGHGIT